MRDRRTMNLGRKAELEEKMKTAAIQIDSAAKAIVLHFEPMDRDLQYIENIDVDVLRVNLKTIKDSKNEYDRYSRELKDVNRELGQ